MTNKIEHVQHAVAGISTAAQTKIGYGVAGAIGSTPLWVKNLTDILQLLAVAVAILVGLSTFYMNMKRIKYYKDLEKES